MIELKTFAQFANIELTDFNPKPTTKTPGQLEASEILWESDDCTTKIGIWECSEGTFTADRTSAAEFCHILSGKASIVNYDGNGKLKSYSLYSITYTGESKSSKFDLSNRSNYFTANFSRQGANGRLYDREGSISYHNKDSTDSFLSSSKTKPSINADRRILHLEMWSMSDVDLVLESNGQIKEEPLECNEDQEKSYEYYDQYPDEDFYSSTKQTAFFRCSSEWHDGDIAFHYKRKKMRNRV